MVSPLEVPRNEAQRKGKAALGGGPQTAAKGIIKAGVRSPAPRWAKIHPGGCSNNPS